MRSRLALLIVVALSGMAHAGEYSAWTASTDYPLLQYRVKYRNYNTARVKEQKSPHDWCFETRNDHPSAVKLRAAITDAGAEAPAKDKWSSLTLDPTKTHESCINFLDTPEGGSVRVWFKEVSVDGKQLAPRCKLETLRPEAQVSKKGELMSIDVISDTGRMTLSRKALLFLRMKKKPSPAEVVLFLGGSGTPKVALMTLAPAYCPESVQNLFTPAQLGAMRKSLEDALETASKFVCALEKNPAKCEAKLKKKVHVSGGVRD